MTVSGLMMISASRQSFQSLERQTQKKRSRRRSFGRLSERLRTRSCCRRTRISAASESLETNRDRKNRKNAEKMAIRVEGCSSEEGACRRNRIAACSAKCKGNKARWNFYQGQVDDGESALVFGFSFNRARQNIKQQFAIDSRIELLAPSSSHFPNLSYQLFQLSLDVQVIGL